MRVIPVRMYRSQGDGEQSRPVSTGALLSFSSVAVPLGMTVIPMLILAPPLYTAEPGPGLALVGSTFALVRVLDVFTDPLIGLCAPSEINV